VVVVVLVVVVVVGPAVVVVVVGGVTQHSVILPDGDVILALTNVGDAISPQVGGATHCTSLVAMIILLVYPAGMNKLLVELSLYLDSTNISNGGKISLPLHSVKIFITVSVVLAK